MWDCEMEVETRVVPDRPVAQKVVDINNTTADLAGSKVTSAMLT